MFLYIDYDIVCQIDEELCLALEYVVIDIFIVSEIIHKVVVVCRVKLLTN